MSSDLLVELLQELDGPQHRFHQYETYYKGEQRLAFVSPESSHAIGNRLSRLVVNIPKTLIDALGERLRVSGIAGVDIWDEWIRNDLDQLSGLVHRSALLYSQSFCIVWSDGRGPRVSVESPREVQVMTDPGTREIVSAVKRYRTKTTTEAYVYLPDRIEHHRAQTAGAATAGFDLIETIDNPIGRVPVVRFLNASLVGEGASEIEPVMALTDALAKITSDMLVASEYLAKPRRFAVGVELAERPKLDADGNPVIDDGEPVMETVNPYPDTDKMMIAESENAKFGQLNGSPLDGYRNAADLILSEISSVTGLAPHYLGILHSNPTSADALRASEASLTAKAEAKQAAFGRSWETVARLMACIRDGTEFDDVQARVLWADAGTRSEAAAADAAVKLFSAGVVSRAGTLKKLGYTADQIEEELEAAADQAINEGPSAGMYGRRGTVRNLEASLGIT